MVAQGVVHATRTEVQALVFLNLYVSKDAGDTTYTPYRVLVTVLHTDRGWLVSALDTQVADRRAKLEHVPVRDAGPRVEGSTP